ncbi:MAG TPA: hypothetical protein VI306_09225 [Pyrinomonadaceae bacterium]
MMTMSKALSAGQAQNYYQKEYTSVRENYYSEGGEVPDAGAVSWPRNGISLEKCKASNMRGSALARTHAQVSN